MPSLASNGPLTPSLARDRWARLQDLFHAARGLSAADRGAVLDRECGSDHELREQVEKLIAADDAPDERLDRAPTDLVDWRADVVEPPPADGRRIGPYRLERVIASGGMGVVYEATQEQPQRAVALKLLRVGFDTVTLQRFLYEAQILAHLTHPGIAHVYESGTLDIGSRKMPWFAMELVRDGKPIDGFMRARQLGLTAKLELFVRVCEAIHHGHQKGVIHRDLKPGNVLVDRDGQPKIIDFGIAKIVDPRLGLTTIDTVAGQVIGTLRYMSPEQASMPSARLDIRTDVYSLGVMLYEICTGEYPYPADREALAESVRVICNSPPALEPMERAGIPDELRIIIRKTLEKEPERRYDSAAQLGRDIRRFLNNEPIEARAPSALYQLRKFAARNRPLVAAVGGVVFALTAGIIATTSAMLEARDHEAAAVVARHEAEDARSRAESARDEAMWSSDFLAEVLYSADPWQGNGPNVTIRDAMDRASARLSTSGSGSRTAEGKVRAVLGEVYTHLGAHARALDQIRAALSILDPKGTAEDLAVLELYNALARELLQTDRLDEAVSVAERSLALHQHALGPDAPETLTTLDLRAQAHAAAGELEQSQALFELVLAKRTELLGAEHADTIQSTANLSNALDARGRSRAAEPLIRRVVEHRRRELGADHPDTLMAMGDLATCLTHLREGEEAEVLFREVIERKRKQLGDQHQFTLLSVGHYATLLISLGRYDEAEPLARAAYDGHLRSLGPDNRETLDHLNSLAVALTERGRLAEAESLHRELLSRWEQRPSSCCGGPVLALGNYAGFLSRAGRLEEAEAHYRRGLSLAEQHYPADYWLIPACKSGLAHVLTKSGRYQEAEHLLVAAYQGHVAVEDGEGQRARQVADNLVQLYEILGRESDADRYRLRPVQVETSR